MNTPARHKSAHKLSLVAYRQTFAPSRLCGMIFLLFSLPLCAAPPAWWSDPQTQILDPTHPATLDDNYAPANLGQLKHIAWQAKAHMDANLPTGSAPELQAQINDLVTNFEPKFGVNYTTEQLASLRKSNYAPINLGQLKAVAEPFYALLLSVSYDTKANLIAHGYPGNWAYDYPWTSTPPKEGQTGYDPAVYAAWMAENYAPANIGQLKAVFSFDLSAPTGQLPAWWLAYYFPGQTGIEPEGDADSDGIVNALEFALRTDPTSANGDGDGDGLHDFTEIASGMNPSASDAARTGNNPLGLIVYTGL